MTSGAWQETAKQVLLFCQSYLPRSETRLRNRGRSGFLSLSGADMAAGSPSVAGWGGGFVLLWDVWLHGRDSTHSPPEATPPPSFDNLKCLQTLPSVPWRHRGPAPSPCLRVTGPGSPMTRFPCSPLGSCGNDSHHPISLSEMPCLIKCTVTLLSGSNGPVLTAAASRPRSGIQAPWVISMPTRAITLGASVRRRFS